MADTDTPRRSFLFSFGLDRLGLIALRAPYIAAGLIAVLTALALLGVSRLSVDDSLSELFRTDTAEFRQYEEIDRRFPSSEYDVLVVVEGNAILSRERLEVFRNAVVELQLTDGVGGLVSMLSARSIPDANGYAAPIVPDELPEDNAAYADIIDALANNDIVKGKFLSDEGDLALIVIALDRATVKERTAKVVINGIKEVVDRELAGSGLTAKLTGAPVMQLEIRNAVERDRLVYNGLGFIAGFAIAYLFFRRLSLTLIAVLGPTIAILWTLGVLGGLDFRLNLFINVITPLILVSGFSDSMHLVFAIRRDILAGVDRIEAARNAVRDVAPACLLTAMNQAIALVSFAFAESALIRTFGLAALMAVFISYTAVAVVVPTLAALLVRREPAAEVDPHEREEGGVGVLQRLSDRVIGFVGARPLAFVLLGLAVVAGTGHAFFSLKPMYRLADQVPDKEQALAATGSLDEKLTGANPVHVMIEWKGGDALNADGSPPIKLYEERTLSVIAEAHEILEAQAGLGNVWSMESLRRWLKEAGDPSIANIQRYVRILPEHLRHRFLTEDETAVLVTARLPDIDASEILPVVEKIDHALDAVRKRHPGYEISVTGLPAIAARNSATLISELTWGLVGDIFLVFIFLGLALRSLMVGVSSVLPSLFPIFATGAILYYSGQGLQFASIVAITVAFSLAIDSTIHFLNRFRLEEERVAEAAAKAELDDGKYRLRGADDDAAMKPDPAREALARTAHHIGPAVILTTIVLALGLGVTVLSDLPSLRLFGELAAICLFASLVGQLVILPATVALFRRHFPLGGRKQPTAEDVEPVGRYQSSRQSG
ncbi:MMPL family transporter [Hyphomicrobium sp.]|uniref:efflux RND transporter permease subunit n=1 Tax=Hyphomicrobium sp. TaxID=82 RepID=UPI0025B83619|nr:MMPL family transporter [Hyphomicrobium sp.]MCC7252481.1 MMPL family transporter [Hyphomicrobium sp.]